MSSLKTKIMACATTDELEANVNIFLAKDEVNAKDVKYSTDGYEKPYSAMILYNEKVVQ